MQLEMSISDSAAPALGKRVSDGGRYAVGSRTGNFIAGVTAELKDCALMPVQNPATGETIREVVVASAADVDTAVTNARLAQAAWGSMTLAARAAVMYDVREAVRSNINLLADVIVEENGKTHADAIGEVKRGLESIEYACALPTNLEGAFSLNVAAGIDVHSTREPLGVAACITPFNFPVMVPLWMIANALSCGNAVVLKPSEKAPSATVLLAQLMTEAGIPAGVLNVINGDASTADALLRHPGVDAVSFVGSTPVAKHVYEVATSTGKRAQALGGAKNHMVVTASADIEAAAAAAVGAAFGAAGERCMAVSVVVAVGNDVADSVIAGIKNRMLELRVGAGTEPEVDFGPLITREHRDRVAGYLKSSEDEGAKILVDGREHASFSQDGYFIGPSLVDNVTASMRVYKDEVFGPVLAVVRVDSLDEALALVKENPFGNGAAIFTAEGAEARRFQTESNIGMIGVNVPIPVPVGWFSFGGWKSSLFGDSHMYGKDGVRFFTRQRVVSTRWA